MSDHGAHFDKWVILVIEDLAVALRWRTTITVLFSNFPPNIMDCHSYSHYTYLIFLISMYIISKVIITCTIIEYLNWQEIWIGFKLGHFGKGNIFTSWLASIDYNQNLFTNTQKDLFFNFNYSYLIESSCISKVKCKII